MLYSAFAPRNDSVKWPVGLGGKGNDGVAAYVKQTPGAIGYVEYAFAKQNNLAKPTLRLWSTPR